jgi:hypothetical protein
VHCNSESLIICWAVQLKQLQIARLFAGVQRLQEWWLSSEVDMSFASAYILYLSPAIFGVFHRFYLLICSCN